MSIGIICALILLALWLFTVACRVAWFILCLAIEIIVEIINLKDRHYD